MEFSFWKVNCISQIISAFQNNNKKRMLYASSASTIISLWLSAHKST